MSDNFEVTSQLFFVIDNNWIRNSRERDCLGISRMEAAGVLLFE